MEDYIGKTYGFLKVIGDTGKINKNGERIFIARHTETGELIESIHRYIKSGETTGYKTSQQFKDDSTRKILKAREKLSTKEEKTRTIKAKISVIRKRKGYYFDKHKNKFVVRIQSDGKTIRVGSFNTEQEAIQARQKAVEEQIQKLQKELERL